MTGRSSARIEVPGLQVDGFADGLVRRYGVEPFGLGFDLVTQEVRTPDKTCVSHDCIQSPQELDDSHVRQGTVMHYNAFPVYTSSINQPPGLASPAAESVAFRQDHN